MQSKVFESQKGSHVWPERTICEVHREIYDLLVLGKYEDIVKPLEEAFLMGIKLCKKLTEYKCSLPEWDKSTPEASKLRELRKELTRKEREISHHLRP